jgi:AAA15 family ATPase/GTPase
LEKINHIEINNFKSIKHLKVDGFKKINVFIGYPNAGKSNILEALGTFGMIDGGQFANLEELVRFNDHSELFFEADVTSNIEVKIDDINLSIENVDVKWNEDGNYLGLNDELEYKFTSDSFDNEYTYDSQSRIKPIKKYHFKLNDFQDNFNDKSLEYPFGENLGKIILSHPIIRKEVKKLFEKNNLRLLIERNSNTLKVFKEYQDETIFTLPYNLIADTLQRLIFYKVAILSNQHTTLLFEEPEAHCFEPYILEFTNSVKYDKNDNQFFIVTHSDFIIQEFLRDAESKENTNIYLVNNVDGETKVKLLDREKNEDVYELGMNPFFNFESLWEAN